MMDDDEIKDSSSSSSTSTTHKKKEEVYYRSEKFEDALEIVDVKPNDAAKLLKEILAEEDTSTNPAMSKSRMKEEAIYTLGRIYAKSGNIEAVKQLFIDIRTFFNTISKPRSAKIVRLLIDEISKMPNSSQLLIELCLDAIDWCIKEKRSFLRQRIQARLAALYCDTGRYKDSLAVIRKLIRDVKKFDDKPLMVEIELVESRVYYLLRNIPKSKGALTSARSSATGFYCPPLLQGQIDMLAGILTSAEKDYKTAFSYFYEAFEGFGTGGDQPQARLALKYMLLTKIMSNQAGDIFSIINSKAGLSHAGPEIEAMRAVAVAYKEQSIHQMADVLKKHEAQLGNDPVVSNHLATLQENLLQANILKLLEPFSRVQITHVARLLDMPRDSVEAKLGQMILDGKLNGTLDQGSDDLILYDTAKASQLMVTSGKIVKDLGACLDRLYAKTSRLAQS